MGTLFKQGVIITASDMYPADLLVEDGRIRLIGAEINSEGHDVVDCAGKYLMPGGVDVHTHLHLPLAQTAANSDFDSGHRAAAFGGTTTHIDFANQPPGGSLHDALTMWQQKAQRAQIDYGFHMTITDPRDDVLAEIPSLLDAGINTLKVLMAYKGSFQVDDTGLFKIMRIAAQHGMLVMVHAENGDLEYLLRHELLTSGLTEPMWHPSSRPAELEAEATNRAVMMSRLTGCPLYIVHMTCAGAVQALRAGRAAGAPVMGETCPQYLALTASEYLSQPGFEASKYVCSPPIREASDQHALWTALRDGTLQVVATDHADFWYEGGVGPWEAWAAAHNNHHWDQYEEQDPSYRRPGKELGKNTDFSKIPNGLPGIEDRMMVGWQLGVNGGEISPSRFVETHCTNPARIFGLYPRKGTLAIGSDADIIVWDPAAEHTISAASHHMHTDYNAYEGLRVEGKPLQVYLRGRKLVDGNQWLGENGYGRYLPRPAGVTVI